MTTEDVGEVKFTAEKASSSAKLKVKGKTGTLRVLDVCQQKQLERLAIHLEAGCKWIAPN